MSALSHTRTAHFTLHCISVPLAAPSWSQWQFNLSLVSCIAYTYLSSLFRNKTRVVPSSPPTINHSQRMLKVSVMKVTRWEINGNSEISSEFVCKSKILKSKVHHTHTGSDISSLAYNPAVSPHVTLSIKKVPGRLQVQHSQAPALGCCPGPSISASPDKFSGFASFLQQHCLLHTASSLRGHTLPSLTSP